ncbi:MAG: hypothetical protein D3924_14990 [Candidatus Electrothrix sp. AR4]|nr:hypothetical protein [Candidatus Electrothrix sp. AR4]
MESAGNVSRQSTVFNPSFRKITSEFPFTLIGYLLFLFNLTVCLDENTKGELTGQIIRALFRRVQQSALIFLKTDSAILTSIPP